MDTHGLPDHRTQPHPFIRNPLLVVTEFDLPTSVCLVRRGVDKQGDRINRWQFGGVGKVVVSVIRVEWLYDNIGPWNDTLLTQLLGETLDVGIRCHVEPNHPGLTGQFRHKPEGRPIC
jgi:hypothetical protein